jgi:hypothetical protein
MNVNIHWGKFEKRIFNKYFGHKPNDHVFVDIHHALMMDIEHCHDLYF